MASASPDLWLHPQFMLVPNSAGHRKLWANTTSVNICLLMTYNVYAVASQLKSHTWSHVLKTVAHVCTWCVAKRLQLNADKTEILWFGSAANLQKLSADELKIRVGQSVAKPVTTVRNLGVLIDAELSLRDHVSRLVQMCFFSLTPSPLSASSARPTRHGTIGLCSRTVTTRLL